MRFASMLLLLAALGARAQVRLNEILVNPPATDDQREYVELRGTANAPLTGLWLLEVDGDRAEAGIVDLAVDLSSISLGANGLLALGDLYALIPFHPLPPDTARADLARPLVPFMENGSITFLLVSNFTGAVGDALDTDTNGVLDVTPWTAVADGVGWKDDGLLDFVYTAAIVRPSAGTADAVTRWPDRMEAEDANAWYGGDVFTNAADQTGLGYVASTVSTGAPTGARLTPGWSNWPSALSPPFVTNSRVLWQWNVALGSNLTVGITAGQGGPDAGQTTVLAASGLPAGATFGGATGAAPVSAELAWNCSTDGVFQLFFTGTDADGAWTQVAEIVVAPAPPGPAPLSAGDVAIVGTINNGAPDSFAVLALTNLPAGTRVYFTDNGWNQANNAFRGSTLADGDGNENLGQLYCVSNIPAGTILSSVSSNDSAYFVKGAIPGTTSGSFNDLSQSSAGEQIYAFVSATETNPLNAVGLMTHLFLFDTTSAFEEGADTNTGNVPPGLTNGVTALAFPLSSVWALKLDNQPRTKAEWQTYIAQATNWTAGSSGALPTGSVVVATGGSLDQDGDGLPDAWEIAQFGSTTPAGSGDADGDGFSNADEFIAVTQPTNARSFFRFESILAGPVSVRLAAVTGRTYRVERATSATAGDWSILSLTNVATPGTLTVLDSGTEPTSGVYRVQVSLP